jgi:hypothetical protein
MPYASYGKLSAVASADFNGSSGKNGIDDLRGWGSKMKNEKRTMRNGQ